MPKKPAIPKRDRLESALLVLGREPKELGQALALYLDVATVEQAGRPSGSQRRGHPNPFQVAAEALIQNPKARRALASALLEALPEPLDLPPEWLEEEAAQHLSSAALLGAIGKNLLGKDIQDWELAQEQLQRWGSTLLAAKIEEASPIEEIEKKQRPPAATNKKSKSQSKKIQKENTEFQRRLHTMDQQLADLQEKLGLERQQSLHFQEERDEARSLAQEEHQRASDSKKRLKQATSASRRELQLAEENEKWEHQLALAQAKVEILQHERDDLRHCLKDLDRFEEFAEEAIPSFRDRPLTAPERELTEHLQSFQKSGGKKFSILVIGGGHPQRRHTPKLEEYAEVLGFRSHWRMAEYISWHKEMDRLQTEMATQYDALVILHWNRTTFGKRARDICNKQGQKPCITCHYEGFVSLRGSLQEVLGQLLRRHPINRD